MNYPACTIDTFAPYNTRPDYSRPDYVLSIGRNGELAAGYFNPAENGDTTHLAVFGQGWGSGPGALQYLAAATRRDNPGTATMLVAHARIKNSGGLVGLPAYLSDLSPRKIGERRADTLVALGTAACDEHGIQSIEYKGHSLGTTDAALAALKSQVQVSRVTLLASSGLHTRHELPGTLSHGTLELILHASAKSTENENNGFLQTTAEGWHALCRRIVSDVRALTSDGVGVYGLDFQEDNLFRPLARTRTIVSGYDVVEAGEGESCAGHFAPTHPGDVPIISQKLNAMYAAA